MNTEERENNYKENKQNVHRMRGLLKIRECANNVLEKPKQMCLEFPGMPVQVCFD